MTDADYSSTRCDARGTMHTVPCTRYYAHGTLNQWPSYSQEQHVAIHAREELARHQMERAQVAAKLEAKDGEVAELKEASNNLQERVSRLLGCMDKQQKALLRKVTRDVRQCRMLGCNVTPARIARPIVVGFQ